MRVDVWHKPAAQNWQRCYTELLDSHGCKAHERLRALFDTQAESGWGRPVKRWRILGDTGGDAVSIPPPAIFAHPVAQAGAPPG